MPAKKSTKNSKSKSRKTQSRSPAKKQEPVRKNKPKVAPEKPKESIDLFDTSGTAFWKATTAVFLLLFLLSIFTQGFSFTENITTTGTSADNPSAGTEDNSDAAASGAKAVGDAVKLDFYVMSQCPYGTQVVDAIKPVLDKLGSNIDFSLNFIANDNGDGTFRSLHGQPEVEGNIAQLCAAKYNPDTYMEMLVCQNKDMGAIPGNWEQCASDFGLDTEKIKACFESEEGKELLRTSIKASEAVSARGSPTIFLNDLPYQGGRTEIDFLKAVCNTYEGTRPDACSDIPEPKKVNAIVISDKRCGSDCDTSRLVGQLKTLFPGLSTKDLDYSEKEAKDIMENSAIKYLPAILFDDSVKEADGYSNIERFVTESGDYLSLQIGSSFDPKAEICDNKVDDDNDGKADCDDTDCEQSMLCRVGIDNHLQVFIMSDCPYGREAVKALKGVNDNFGDNIDYEIHYIAQEAGDGFSSLHGQYEVDENIVQLCTKKHSPEVWFDYMYCRSTKGVREIEWIGCAEETGVDTALVETCSTTDVGKDLLREDIKIANSLGISASPTWLANNRYTFGGIDSETVKINLCKYNEGLEGCDTTLSSDTGGVPAGSC